ncbi:hypothetical protein OCU04_010249 [Sclerotinia nivalis]|uniref:Uncharacterized protein n=1 Tax=Sclerotinia nivalis TaxID=352851 RepID=A0A9X0AE56_9HELO|nr:hypothetical protein OCU04_010249 [Sclerotinia nivalis]
MPPRRSASEMTGNSENAKPSPLQMIKEARKSKKMAIEEYLQSSREAMESSLENESKIQELRENLQPLEERNVDHQRRMMMNDVAILILRKEAADLKDIQARVEELKKKLLYTAKKTLKDEMHGMLRKSSLRNDMLLQTKIEAG